MSLRWLSTNTNHQFAFANEKATHSRAHNTAFYYGLSRVLAQVPDDIGAIEVNYYYYYYYVVVVVVVVFVYTCIVKLAQLGSSREQCMSCQKRNNF